MNLPDLTPDLTPQGLCKPICYHLVCRNILNLDLAWFHFLTSEMILDVDVFATTVVRRVLRQGVGALAICMDPYW